MALLTGEACGALPLEALLLLPLLADLGELPLVVLPRPRLLGFPPRVVLHPLHLLLPGLHQLVVALADVLLLPTSATKKKAMLAVEQRTSAGPAELQCTAWGWIALDVPKVLGSNPESKMPYNVPVSLMPCFWHF